MVELFAQSGILTLGSRLRLLADTITKDAGEIYRLYGLDIKPKWFPVLYVLMDGNEHTVTEIAKFIGQTHPSVSNLLKELIHAGIVEEIEAESDKRTTPVRLTKKGMDSKPRLQIICDTVRNIAASIDADSTDRLWEALAYWEKCLSEKTLLARVTDEKRRREASVVRVVDYRPEHLVTFKRLNIMWINSYWTLEPHDVETLSDPQGTILDKGGHILVALLDEKPVGVVALCRMNHPEYDYELAKLAVDPDIRGRGIGLEICTAAIKKAKTLGARKIFLESNTILKPAIALYHKLGFRELPEYHPAYERGNIQMELTINE